MKLSIIAMAIAAHASAVVGVPEQARGPALDAQAAWQLSFVFQSACDAITHRVPDPVEASVEFGTVEAHQFVGAQHGGERHAMHPAETEQVGHRGKWEG